MPYFFAFLGPAARRSDNRRIGGIHSGKAISHFWSLVISSFHTLFCASTSHQRQRRKEGEAKLRHRLDAHHSFLERGTPIPNSCRPNHGV